MAKADRPSLVPIQRDNNEATFIRLVYSVKTCVNSIEAMIHPELAAIYLYL